MMTPTRRIVSPLFVFVVVLALFELFVRLPYVLYVARSPTLGTDAAIHFFGLTEPTHVISLGLGLVVLAVSVTVFVFALIGPRHVVSHSNAHLPQVHWSIYVIWPIFIVAAVLSILALGVDTVVADFSGKRTALGERGALWVLLRLAVFCHLIAAVFYLRMIQTGSRIDRLLFIVTVFMVVAPAVVFSQRAVIIGFGLEIIYLQLLLGTFRLRGLLRMVGLILVVLVTISALRPEGDALTLSEGLVFGVEKAVQSRYYFDFAKIGAVVAWADPQAWLGPVVVGFLLEPFLADQVIFYKETGPLIAQQVYLYRAQNGVTPGFLLESILSFGIPAGIFFFAAVLAAFLWVEKWLFQTARLSLAGLLFGVLTLSKVSLLLNSSLGAFAFQMITEGAMLAVVLGVMGIFSGAGRPDSTEGGAASCQGRTQISGISRGGYAYGNAKSIENG